MKDFIEIGSSPYGEDCAQLGSLGYYDEAQRELNAYRNQIRRVLGEEPKGALLKIKGFEHDFGRYYILCCEFDVANEEATSYAFKCEAKSPEYWDDIAKQELGI